MSLYQYLFTVIKINYLVLGGASLTAPFYFQYFVEQNLIPEQEINHYLTMSNILPGAMSIYMTAYCGLYLHGKRGMILGLTILFTPIIIISILVLEFINRLPFDINSLIYVSLPIIIVASIDYLTTIFKSELAPKFKFGIFAISLLLLTLTMIGTIQLIIIYILVIFFLTRGGKHA